MFEGIAGEEVEVALATGGAVVGMVDRDGAHLGVVESGVDDDLGDAGLEVFEEAGVEGVPLVGGHLRGGPK